MQDTFEQMEPMVGGDESSVENPDDANSLFEAKHAVAAPAWSHSEGLNSEFRAWCGRRLAGIRSELGFVDKSLFSPHLALELSQGCSMQCWYCGFAAEPLNAVLDYSTAESLFCSVLRQAFRSLGQGIAPSSLLFHATEPHDNPDYLRFMHAFEHLSGCKPFTSTAASHDLDWIRALLDYYKNAAHEKLRINFFSEAALERAKESIPADRLAGVEIQVISRAEGSYPVKPSGRLFRTQCDLRDISIAGLAVNPGRHRAPPRTIACLVGFKINMVMRTLELVAPCQPSEKWPLGYRIFDQDTFDNEHDFALVLARLMRRAMPASFPLDGVLRFRDDLQCEIGRNAIRLVSPSQIHTLTDISGLLGRIAVLVMQGCHTRRAIQQLLIADGNAHSLQTAMIVQQLFNGGFLDECNLLVISGASPEEVSR